MQITKLLPFFLICFLSSVSLFAQEKKPASKKAEITTVPKFKPPKLHTSLDGFKDSASISVEDALRVIGMPLKIYDDKKNEYSVSSYQFLYRKKGVTEDEESGKLKPTTTISSDRFKVSPLPQLWINLIREQVKSGEEFYFFDVIAKNAQGIVMYASNLKLTIR